MRVSKRNLLAKNGLIDPEAIFVLDNVRVTGGNTGIASGQLTLRGVTNPVTFDAEFLAGLTNPLTRKYTVGFENSYRSQAISLISIR